MKSSIFLTKEGVSRLEEQITVLEAGLREMIRDPGTLEEFSVREETLSKELVALRSLLARAEVVEPCHGGDTVALGSTVVVQFPDGSESSFTVTDPICTDPGGGFISYECPIAKGLLGGKEGERRSCMTANGPVEVLIRKVF